MVGNGSNSRAIERERKTEQRGRDEISRDFFFFFIIRERVGFVCVEICCSYSTRWFVFLYLSEISFPFLNDCEGFVVI